MKRVSKDKETNWKGRTVVFRGLAAWVCETCGEQTYKAKDARFMQEYIRSYELDSDWRKMINLEEVTGFS